MPRDVLADPHWKCPACYDMCNCQSCRLLPGWTKYKPKSTPMGHDTKEVADPRSVESLVDFSCDNLRWIADSDDAEEEEILQRSRERSSSHHRIDEHVPVNGSPEPAASQASGGE